MRSATQFQGTQMPDAPRGFTPAVCPVATTLNLLSTKWRVLILRDLLTGPKRYSELQHSIDGISQKMLTANLKAMEKDGLVTREVYAEVPPRVEYSLTDLGESMRPMIDSIRRWGLGYLAWRDGDDVAARAEKADEGILP